MNLNHSKFVARNYYNAIVDLQDTTGSIRYFGRFQKYPDGVFNPAFCGMMLWELAPNHILNDYKISQFHQIKSGVIMYGHNAYVFTPITNNDIQSFLKILLRKKMFKHNLPPIKASKLLVKYVREKGTNHIIPSIPSIQQKIKNLLGITEQMYIGDENTYLTLLHRLYILTFMVRYKMPLQRRFSPGNRNLASSVHCFKGKGWYSYLTKFEQNLLNNEETILAAESIPEDMLHGICRSDLVNISKSSYTDIQNTSFFRDGSVNSMDFQNKIHMFRYLHTSQKEKPKSIESPSQVTSHMIKTSELSEVPTIKFLKKCVKDCIDKLKVPVKDLITTDSWHSQFHRVLENDDLTEEFPPWVLPSCYGPEKSCSHILHVDLQDVATNTLHLTTLENISLDSSDNNYSPVNVAATFIFSVIFHNPIWDIGLQHQLIKSNDDKLFKSDISAKRYTSKCVCPCSGRFGNWHKETHINMLPNFNACSDTLFDDHTSFVKHLYSHHNDYYHRIILRIVQSSYSTLISKMKISSKPTTEQTNKSTFSSIHQGTISLPIYSCSSSDYNTFSIKKNGTTITLIKTNILMGGSKGEYSSYFSESSFRKTLKKLTMCGEYNKTKKRSTPMYCYGSTITCTRYCTLSFSMMAGLKFYQGHTSLPSQTKRVQM